MKTMGVVAVTTVLGAVLCWAQSENPNRAKIAAIGASLLHDGNDAADSERVSQVRDLIRSEILDQLNAGKDDPPELKSRLEPILESGWKTPTSVVRKRVNGTNFVLVAYSVVHGPAALPSATSVVEAFQKNGLTYEAVASTGADLEGSRVKLDELSSPWPNEIWVLAHGQQMQVMQYQEKIRIYSLDGSKFKALWAPTPKGSPTFKISKDAIAMTYLVQSDGAWETLHQTLLLTPGGVTESAALP